MANQTVELRYEFICLFVFAQILVMKMAIPGLCIRAGSVLTETEEPAVLTPFFGTDKEPEPKFCHF